MKFVLRNESWKLRLHVFVLLSLCVLLPATGQNRTSNDTIASHSGVDKYSGKRDLLLKTQDAATLLQSVTSVSGDKLLHRPIFQMENTFDGTLPGLVVNPSNGYSTSQSSLSLRGRSILIVVDGIPRSDANIPASQIESVSVIKDGLGLGALGMSSGNGVIYIKTKKGGVHSMKIELTAQMAFNQQINRAQFLNSYEYTKLLNEALANDGMSPMYSDTDIEMYRTGANPYTHPNVNWYDELTRKTAPLQQYNLNISGGSKVARYFVDLNVYDEQGFLKQDKSVNSYSTQENFKKYSLRANTDINVTANTLLNVNVFGQMFRETTPGNGVMGSIYPAIHQTPNNAYPVFNPNGSFGGNPFYPKNIYAQSVYSGYYLYPKTDFNIDATLEHRFKNVLEGLYVSGTYSYNSSYRESLLRNKNFETFYYWKEPGDTNEDTPANYIKLTDKGAQNNDYDYNRQNRMQYLQLSAGYDFSFLENNNMRTKASYLYNDYTVYGIFLPLVKNGFNVNVEYDFDQKYMAEFALSGMSLNQLHPGGRWGYFPSAGIGWNLSKEDWFSESVNDIDLLKLRLTYGMNGSDGSGAYYRAASGMFSNYYFTYIKRYLQSGSVTLGASPSGNNIYIESALPYLSKWEKINRLNFGIDVQAFDKKLQGSVEFFHNVYSDLLMGGKISFNGLLGGNLVNPINIGKYRQNGVELVLDYNDRFGNVNVSMNANATIHQTKLLVDGGLNYPEEYMLRVGNPNGMTFGYVAEGYFQNQAEIDAYLQKTKISGYAPQPGDLRYVDVNGDGVLDGKDVKAIGSKAPRVEYGFYLAAEWKGLSISSQWAGIANRYLTIQDMPFGIGGTQGGYGQALEEHLDRWSPNNPNAAYPRLSAVSNSYNTWTSTHWLKNASFLRLKNLELGYMLPQQWTSSLKLSKVKVFTNAYNLLTLTGLENRDPELPHILDGDVPNVSSINFGLNIQF